ncbi:hypothetical protein [Streptomyces sp. NBC_01264]|uniref:hypothetical protein n=1 Tax=Streptomyces sp. NBC_01264 TaxID=2903804 RepID=UPI00224D1D20|nr:hypothetical protein [Streptomyces sp. NBC_01264]MCX4779443.1 hypothetical protein [Streptomyces sp. NBC_01264]
MARSRGRWLPGVALPVVLVAVGLGGWYVYDWYGAPARSRAEIAEACQGLVDPDAVMRAGGLGRRITASTPGKNQCSLWREVTFEGQERPQEYLSLVVTASKDAEPGASRFEWDARSVTVIARCAGPARSAGVLSFQVTARIETDAATRGKPGFLPELTREAALRAAARAGCETSLPEAPKI